jgi:hypothetical protein
MEMPKLTLDKALTIDPASSRHLWDQYSIQGDGMKICSRPFLHSLSAPLGVISAVI